MCRMLGFQAEYVIYLKFYPIREIVQDIIIDLYIAIVHQRAFRVDEIVYVSIQSFF